MFTRSSISLLLIIAVVTWGAFLWILGIQLTWEHAKPYSLTLAVLTGGWSLFNKYLWRMWPCKLFVRRPNLNGTWKAELRSTYRDPATGEPRGLIDAYVAIRQTFTSLSVRLLTAGDHESFLVASSFDINADGTTYVYGVYQGVPSISDRKAVSAIHYGSFRYKAIGSPVTGLSGHYWTDRETGGSIDLSDRQPELFDSFASAEKARKPGGE
ncbi:hypothetical protein GOL81_30730 [Sinorhizobium medicae]|nr:hypothetical protein [Sinorhizobium medicae]MDX0729305.1 hypothetical protein [Sinorhizobium medicae]MDX0735536.1 hypothetical protein [Sinorhizobium medicae]MDX0815536.1 hypothetical protein [Sinorhizobium medicae]MDX1103645.1 hypothetical protein [Sinorhizobium medicae]